MPDNILNYPVVDQKSCDCCDYEYDFARFIDNEKPWQLGPCRKYRGNMVMCPSCLQKEIALQIESAKTADVRVTEARNLEALNTTLDIHNSHLASINELKAGIESDESIPNAQKKFALASTLDKRFKKLLELQNEHNQALKTILEEQKSIQLYYNDLAKQLRDDERGKLSLMDVTYKPPAKSPKPKAVTVKKYDPKECARLIAEAGLPSATLAAVQMLVVAKNMTPVDAVRQLKEKMGL